MSRLVIDLLRPYRGWLAIVFAAMLVEIAASLAAPWPLQLVIDDALGAHHLPRWLEWAHEYAGFGKHTLGVALFAGVATVAIATIGAVASYVDNYYTTSMGQWIANDLRLRIYEHLHRPDGRAHGTEQRQVEDQHQAHALPGIAAVDIALHPVVGRAMAELLDRLGVFCFRAVQLGAAPHHRVQAPRLRAVGIVHRLALGVVLAVDGHPFLGDHARADPQPEAEEVRRNRMQIQGAVGLRAVQEDRDRRDGDMGGCQRVEHDLPPRPRQHTMAQPVDHGIQNRPIG